MGKETIPPGVHKLEGIVCSSERNTNLHSRWVSNGRNRDLSETFSRCFYPQIYKADLICFSVINNNTSSREPVESKSCLSRN